MKSKTDLSTNFCVFVLIVVIGFIIFAPVKYTGFRRIVKQQQHHMLKAGANNKNASIVKISR